MDYLVVKWLHILSATLIFGTGLGSAFYLFFANRSGDVRAIAVVARYVVIADWVFTTPAVIVQPLTGVYLMLRAGFAFSLPWIVWTWVLYALAAACWLPVVWLQIRMRDMAQLAQATGGALPPRYWRYARIWVWLGIPAFASMVAVFYLMVAKPN